MALTPDYIFKRGDVGQVIKRQLWQTLVDETPDLVTGRSPRTPTRAPVPLTVGDTVTLLLKEIDPNSLNISPSQSGGGGCTIVDATQAIVSYTLQAADLNQARYWVMEHEVVKAGTGEVITVPDEPDPINGRTLPYFVVQVLADLGGS
jgi:hypothetical protein